MKRKFSQINIIIFILIFQLLFIRLHISIAAEAAESYFDKGHTYYWSGDYDEAIKYLTKAIETAPEWKFYEVRADAYMAKYDYAEAIKDCDTLIGLKPGYANTYIKKGDVFRVTHEYKKAMDNYNKAIELNDELAYYHRGDLYLDLGNYNQALKDYDIVSKTFLDKGFLSLKYGDIYYAMHDYGQAVNYYKKAIELGQGAGETYYKLGKAYNAIANNQEAKTNYNEALKLLDKLVKSYPKNDAYYNLRGMIYYESGDYDNAINNYTEAVKLNPKQAEAYYNRGRAYGMKEIKSNSASDYENMLKDFNSAIELIPNYYEAYYRRGIAYMDKGDSDAAIKDYNKAIEINPNYSNIYNARGIALEFNNDNAGALKDYGKALELDSKNSSARHNLNALNEKLGKNQPKSDSAPQTPGNKTAETKSEQKFSTEAGPVSAGQNHEKASAAAQNNAANKLKNSAGRYALIIGNSEYAENKLINTVNDARLMEKTLKKCGFDVTSGENLNKKKIKELVRGYVSKLDKDSAALFFYSGHGVQYRGENYLVPLEFDLKNEHEIEDECVNANWIIEEIGTARPGITIIILDACRNNPFGKGFKRSLSRGLASVEHPAQGTLIAYSTSPNQTASDGTGQNSPYTEALVNNMLKPGIDILKVFQQTRKEVYSKTKDQLPWENQSLMDDFYFIEK